MSKDNSVNLIEVVETNGITKMEEGKSDTITIELLEQPGTGIQVDIRCSSNPNFAIDRSNLTFNSNNWNIPQLVIITALENASVTGKRLEQIGISQSTSIITNNLSNITPQRSRPDYILNVEILDNDGVEFVPPQILNANGACQDIELSLITATELLNSGSGLVEISFVYDQNLLTITPNVFIFNPNSQSFISQIVTICSLETLANTENLFTSISLEIDGNGTQYEGYSSKVWDIIIEKVPTVMQKESTIHNGLIRTGGF